MDIEQVKCECCGLKEDCTTEYIDTIKAKFQGKWLCGLCSEAVRDELSRTASTTAVDAIRDEQSRTASTTVIVDAVRAHMWFCSNYKSSPPATRVADGMKEMLRRRYGHMSTSTSSTTTTSSRTKKCYGRSIEEDDGCGSSIEEW